MSFPAYPKYKDSGVEWLGEVPEHWRLQRLRHIADISGGGTPSREKEEYWNGDIPWVSPKDMKTEAICSAEECITSLGLANSTTALYPSGTLLMVIRSGILQHTLPVAINEVPVSINQDLKAIRFHTQECVPRYFLRWVQGLNDQLLLAWANEGATVESLNQTLLQSSVIPLPPLPEQQTIASFLDHETAKIDSLVSEQQRLIELLKEKRQAVISHAVTKGLNPNVRMKPSGIEWLGDVPEHWEVGPVKRFLQSLDGRRIPLSTEERSYRIGDFPYYGASGIIDSVDDFIFDEDLVLVSEDGANLLNRSSPISFVASGKYWVNNHAHILKPSGGNLQFWAERIEAVDLVPFVTGSAQPKFTADALMNLKIAVPPSTVERAEIEAYFFNASQKLDTLLDQAKCANNLLQERRTALISAAVTGKIDVRAFAKTEAVA